MGSSFIYYSEVYELILSFYQYNSIPVIKWTAYIIYLTTIFRKINDNPTLDIIVSSCLKDKTIFIGSLSVPCYGIVLQVSVNSLILVFLIGNK